MNYLQFCKVYINLLTIYNAAGKITEGIATVAKQTTPSMVASVEGVRKAMGVSLDSLPLVENKQVASTVLTSEPDQRDIESELSKLLGEDGVSEVMTDLFH